MPKFEISEALKHYFEEPKIRAAVDALLNDLAGEKMPESNWPEARNYNKALLMAMQVRTDFVELHFKIWEETFGKAIINRLGRECFPREYNPYCIWDERELGLAYYRISPPEDGMASDTLCVSSVNDEVGLRVYRWSDDDTQSAPSALVDVEGWRSLTNDNDQWAETTPIPVPEFIDDPNGHILSLKADAERVVAKLVEDGPAT